MDAYSLQHVYSMHTVCSSCTYASIDMGANIHVPTAASLSLFALIVSVNTSLRDKCGKSSYFYY